MTKNYTYKAVFGMALLLGAGALGIAGAHGTQGTMGGSQSGMGMMQGGGTGMMQGGGTGMMPGLDLNAEQQSQMRERRSEHRKQQLTRMGNMLDLRDEMHMLMAEQRPDPEAVQELHGRMADLQGEMLANRIRLRNEIQDMLTDEQRDQMRGRMQQQRGHMEGGRGSGGYYQGHHGGGW